MGCHGSFAHACTLIGGVAPKTLRSVTLKIACGGLSEGATRAFAGEYLSGSIFSKYGHPVIIPGDMGTASYVLVGKKENMKLSFGSTCHGAGRKLSRKKSMESFKSEQVKEKLENEGIYLRAVSSSTIAEESPGSYKNINDVIMAVRDANLAIPVSRNVPVAVMKG